jgi:hypothetical protein
MRIGAAKVFANANKKNEENTNFLKIILKY